MERGLAPGRAARLRHDRGDDIDQLRQAGGAHAVGVLEQGNHQITEHHGVGGAVHILEQARGNRPIADAFRILARLFVEIPDIPFIERDEHVVLALQPGLGCIDGGGDIVDETVHIDARGKEALHVTGAIRLKFRMVVRMAGDEVDVVKRLLKYGFFPLAEGVHHVAG